MMSIVTFKGFWPVNIIIQQTNIQNRTKCNFENKKQIIGKWVHFSEFRGFLNFERKFDLDVSSDKQWLGTHVSQFCPAGLKHFPFGLWVKIFDVFWYSKYMRSDAIFAVNWTAGLTQFSAVDLQRGGAHADPVPRHWHTPSIDRSRWSAEKGPIWPHQSFWKFPLRWVWSKTTFLS